jgi:hypothetical protein
MVHYSSLILSFAVLTTAVPTSTSDSSIVHSDFSFSSWVDSLISDPTSALTPEQALEHFNASLTSRSNPLQKRVTCEQKGDQPALIGDVASCNQELIARGAAGQQCNVDSVMKSQCRRSFAQIVTVKGDPFAGPKTMNCNEIAKVVGLIMDSCTTKDGTVGGQMTFNDIAVYVQQPLI